MEARELLGERRNKPPTKKKTRAQMSEIQTDGRNLGLVSATEPVPPELKVPPGSNAVQRITVAALHPDEREYRFLMLMLPDLVPLGGGGSCPFLKAAGSTGHGWFTGTAKQQEIDVNQFKQFQASCSQEHASAQRHFLLIYWNLGISSH